MKRIFLFLLTNLAIVAVLSISLRLLGVDHYLDANGLNISSLLIFAVVMGFGGSFISLAISKWSAKRMTGAQVIETPTSEAERWLLNTVRQQATAAGIDMPEVAIYDSPEPNAFATGMSRNSALVAVSTGLLRGMTHDEIEAVLAHEISHVANGDMVTLALVQGVVNTFVFFFARIFGYFVDRVILKNEEGRGIGYWVASMVAELVLGVLAMIVVQWVSRHREFRADAGSAALAGRDKMIGALRRLDAAHPQPLPEQMSAFGIAGKNGGGLSALFMSHPPIAERIAALQALR
ncbi:protease HtpX [Rhodocyclus tenuis]|uniref:Protease HtpX homolog n=1 Tax=Rhodocyclus gracilis TaxID=2929842 RepID=A0ABX0WH87_9RHOO|nr:protease HtpX [Rhodocyclus gracilis]NJA87783.1 protease HtpX [Rhodocyclus gracilis]